MVDSKPFFEEFIEDYYAECSEHLTVVRRDVLALEHYVDAPEVDPDLLDELFRSFHTLKGLSAMVGLKEAERLAHGIESTLAALKKAQIALSRELLETLVEVLSTFEEVIAAHKQERPAPDVSPLLDRIGALSSGSVPSEAAGGPVSTVGGFSPEEGRRFARAVQSGARAWRFEFTPDHELVERGVNVNRVRTRLKEIGELIRAKPEVGDAGKISFEFIVATSKEEQAFEDLAADGVTWAPFEVQPPARASAEPSTKARRQDERAASYSSSFFSSSMVRVDLGKLDALIQSVGELVILRARLDESLRQIESQGVGARLRDLQDVGVAMERELRGLREGIMHIRMVPIQEVFDRMRFVARDLAREFGKNVAVEIHGGKTEIDKYLVERMMDPLLHIVRNAVSHGLEPEEERVARGKPPAGKLTLRASTAGETVGIEIEDDGRGIDSERVARRAQSSGLLPQGIEVDRAGLLRIISEAGFTTLAEADLTSGRGVGMAVVKETVQELGGSVSLDTAAGRGTRFTLSLPLTLSIADALIVSVEGQTYALPTSSVREVIEVEPASVRVLENNEIIPYRDGALPLIRLGKFFRLEGGAGGRHFYALVLGDSLSPVGLVVDRLVGQREIVVRSLEDPLLDLPYLSGATELGNRRVVLILDAQALVLAARNRRAAKPGAWEH